MVPQHDRYLLFRGGVRLVVRGRVVAGRVVSGLVMHWAAVPGVMLRDATRAVRAPFRRPTLRLPAVVVDDPVVTVQLVPRPVHPPLVRDPPLDPVRGPLRVMLPRVRNLPNMLGVTRPLSLVSLMRPLRMPPSLRMMLRSVPLNVMPNGMMPLLNQPLPVMPNRPSVPNMPPSPTAPAHPIPT